NADPGGRRNDSRQLKTGRVEERSELIFRALPATGAYQHVNIVGGGTPTLVRRIDAQWINAFDEQQFARAVHRPAAALEDRLSALVIPVMDNVLEDIGIATARHLAEEVATEHVAAILQPTLSYQFPGPLGNVGLLEEDSTQGTVGLQNAGQQCPVAATDVDDDAKCREVVSARNRNGDLSGETRHGLVEVGGFVGMHGHIGERVHSEDAIERRIAGLDAVEEITPCLIGNTPEKQRDGMHRTRHAGPQT